MDVLDVVSEFGSTGRVESLHLGADLLALVAVYGIPWDIGRIDKRQRWPYLYSYGDVEFVVCRCRIIASITVPSTGLRGGPTASPRGGPSGHPGRAQSER
jgi:hypothetical protein